MQTREYVIFSLCGEYYGISIHNVENIEKKATITRVPHSRPYVNGIMNLRGNIVPVVDLRKRFGLELADPSYESRIIIVNYDDHKIGLVVDTSSETLQLSDENIDQAPTTQSTVSEEFIKEVGKHDDRIIMLLDLKKVLGIVDEEQ